MADAKVFGVLNRTFDVGFIQEPDFAVGLDFFELGDDPFDGCRIFVSGGVVLMACRV